MRSCESVREQLVLFAERELAGEELTEVRSHLESCAACREDLAGIETIQSLLSDPDLLVSRGIRWDALPAKIASLARERQGSSRWLPSNFGSWGWAATVAASLLLVVLTLGRLYQPISSTDTVSAEEKNQEFVRQLASVYAKAATSRYLAECQDWLLDVMRAEQSCNGEKYDLSTEVERARELLKRKRLLDGELRDPGVARAKELCDEIENVLVSLSMAQSCESEDTLKSLERIIQREQLMLRINLVRSELS